uniref:Uncharacterized protein n=1 Tax=Manihot esculenta TaxID=3983 RepID=A0A2C9UU03_MANES
MGEKSSDRRMEKLSKCGRKLKKILLTPLRRCCKEPILSSTSSRAVRCEELFLSSQQRIKSRTRNAYDEDPFITPHIAAQNHFRFMGNIYI